MSFVYFLIFEKQSSSNSNHNHNNHNNEIDQLKRDVRQALTSVRDIFRISQIKIKRKMASPNSGNRILTRAEVEILVNPELKIRRVHAVARQAREKIESVLGIDEADVHLELDDGGMESTDGGGSVCGSVGGSVVNSERGGFTSDGTTQSIRSEGK